MKRGLERIYYRTPVFLQNLAVTAYGYKLRRERYAPAAARYLESLQRSAAYAPDQMRRHLDDRFRAMVAHALTTVPFWREWAREHGAESGDFRGLDDLASLPVVSKDLLRQRAGDFLSEAFAGARHLIRLSTSGTSGSPLTVVCDRDARTHHYAFFTRLRLWFGVNEGDRRATLFGRIIMDPNGQRPPFWRYDAAQRNLLMSSYHLSPANLGHYTAELRRFQPEEVIGYPSSVYQLARQVLAADEPRLTPRVVFTTAETLLAHQRAAIAQAFACPVVDQYGCTEMAFFVSQCEAGTMHVHPEHGWLEALDDAGRPVPAGTPGRCVATGLVNPVLPLLRYEVGDVVVLGDGRCDCGRAFPVVERVEGRIDDVIVTPDGRPLGRMDPVFKGRSGIVECQIIQTDPSTLEFDVVADGNFDAAAEQNLLTEIRLRVGAQMQIRIRRVDAIPRGRNGKFKTVVRRF
jgi:phenylacetate-CoA ligase